MIGDADGEMNLQRFYQVKLPVEHPDVHAERAFAQQIGMFELICQTKYLGINHPSTSAPATSQNQQK